MRFKAILNLSFLITTLLLLQSCSNSIIIEKSIKHPDWSSNATIYEVNVRQFSKEGTFDEVTKQIPRLKEMGIDILWLMPIHPIGKLNRKGTYGSYYAVRDFKAVNPEFGTINDFNRLVKIAHNNNMRVIIDWVANHTAWDNVWTASKPEFFTLNKEGKFTPPVEDWSDVIDLNYNNKELWEYMYDAMAYWVKESDIDGFRCDVAAMVPIDFWKWVRPKLEDSKPLFMLAEGFEPELHQVFNMTYSWQLKDVFVEYAKGGKSTEIFYTYFENERKNYPADAYRMVFTTNHDENSWNGTDSEIYGDAAEVFTAIACTVPGMPLVYSGQEAGLNKRLSFFEKDPIEWNKSKYTGIFSSFFKLKKENKALWNGKSGGELLKLDSRNNSILSFSRTKENNKIIALFNLSDSAQLVKISNPVVDDTFYNLFEKKGETFSSEMNVELKPWEYIIYYK